MPLLPRDGKSGGGGTSVHNNLQGLQGGKADERYHLTKEQHESLGDGGLSEVPADGEIYGRKNRKWVPLPLLDGRPQTPQNLNPYDGEFDVYQFARFIGTNYVQNNGIPMGALQLQIAKNTEMTADLTVVPAEQKVFAAFRYKGGNGTESKWSPFVDFSAAPITTTR